MRIAKLAAAVLPALLVFSGTPLAQQPSSPDAMSPAERQAIESVIKDYLLKNPVVIREAMEALRAQEEQERQELAAVALKKHRSALISDPDAPVGGNPDGDVTVVEFFDYQCGYCKRVAPAMEALVAGDAGVRIVYKELPILGPQSLVAARAALAAQRQGQYVAFHQAMMAAEQPDDATIESVATSLGLDHARLRKDMDDPAILEVVQRNHQLASAIGINGTPAFIIGDRLIPGAIDAAAMAGLVAEERTKR